MVTVVFDKKYKINKEQLVKKFAEYNIQVRPFFYPLSSLPFIKIKSDTPVAFDISTRALNLPCGQLIRKKDVDYICKVLIKILKE